MPVPKDSKAVLRDHAQNECGKECVRQTLHLHLGDLLATKSIVHAADGHCRGGGSWEDQTKLASDVDDEELSKWCAEGEAKVCTDDCQADQTAEVILW